MRRARLCRSLATTLMGIALGYLAGATFFNPPITQGNAIVVMVFMLVAAILHVSDERPAITYEEFLGLLTELAALKPTKEEKSDSNDRAAT